MKLNIAYTFYRYWHRFASWLDPQKELAGLEDAAQPSPPCLRSFLG
jgi:hypothetical protein